MPNNITSYLQYTLALFLYFHLMLVVIYTLLASVPAKCIIGCFSLSIVNLYFAFLHILYFCVLSAFLISVECVDVSLNSSVCCFSSHWALLHCEVLTIVFLYISINPQAGTMITNVKNIRKIINKNTKQMIETESKRAVNFEDNFEIRASPCNMCE